MDNSIQPENDMMSDNDDLPVDLGTLEVNGVRPSVGDSVDLKVRGNVSKIVDQVAWVTPETVNDLPIPAEPNVTEDQLMKSAEAHDSMNGMTGMGM